MNLIPENFVLIKCVVTTHALFFSSCAHRLILNQAENEWLDLDLVWFGLVGRRCKGIVLTPSVLIFAADDGTIAQFRLPTRMFDFLGVHSHQFLAHLEELQLLLRFVIATKCEDRSRAFLCLFSPLIEETVQVGHFQYDVFV